MFHKNSKGFALAYALFLMAIFGILGAAIVIMLNTSSVSSSEELLSVQALYLAESGAEIRIRKALEGDTSETTKIIKYDGFNNFSSKVKLDKIATTPDGEELYSLYSTGEIFNIKRKIYIKFWK